MYTCAYGIKKKGQSTALYVEEQRCMCMQLEKKKSKYSFVRRGATLFVHAIKKKSTVCTWRSNGAKKKKKPSTALYVEGQRCLCMQLKKKKKKKRPSTALYVEGQRCICMQLKKSKYGLYVEEQRARKPYKRFGWVPRERERTVKGLRVALK